MSGGYAFRHKAGAHIDGEEKWSAAFQHTDPAQVGNSSGILISDQSGRAAVAKRLRELAPGTDKNDPCVTELLARIKNEERMGYQYENADGSLALMMLETLGRRKRYFELLDFKIVLSDPTKSDVLTGCLLKIAVLEVRKRSSHRRGRGRSMRSISRFARRSADFTPYWRG